MKEYTTYVIRSKSRDMLYIGQTGNLEDRLLRYNQNRNTFTKNKGPWELIFSRSFPTRQEAVALERKLKRFKNKYFLLNWIARQAGLDHPDLQSVL